MCILHSLSLSLSLSLSHDKVRRLLRLYVLSLAATVVLLLRAHSPFIFHCTSFITFKPFHLHSFCIHVAIHSQVYIYPGVHFILLFFSNNIISSHFSYMPLFSSILTNLFKMFSVPSDVRQLSFIAHTLLCFPSPLHHPPLHHPAIPTIPAAPSLLHPTPTLPLPLPGLASPRTTQQTPANRGVFGNLYSNNNKQEIGAVTKWR